MIPVLAIILIMTKNTVVSFKMTLNFIVKNRVKTVVDFDFTKLVAPWSAKGRKSFKFRHPSRSCGISSRRMTVLDGRPHPGVVI